MTQGFFETLPLWLRVASVLGLAVLVHLAVGLLRHLTWRFIRGRPDQRWQKLRSILSLASSTIVFSLYFIVVGLLLQQMGISLTAYLASASVIGLAIAFGSQGVVQDVVNGVTLIFSGLLDLGDLVEISGQTGIVKNISMRFVELENAIGASVFIPNRQITNVVSYPRGYVRCIVDVTLPGDAAQKDQADETAVALMQSYFEQFPGIFRTEPSREGRFCAGENREILRLKFRIWPNRAQPIEANFAKELTAALTRMVPDYRDWMIVVSYEVERRRGEAS